MAFRLIFVSTGGFKFVPLKEIYKMLSEKIYNWVAKHLILLLLILIISIVPLYILQFKELFNDENIKVLSLFKDVLLMVGAIISTYFLYLTFQQARIANELKVYETSFEEFNRQIVEKEKMIWTSVFSEDEEKIIYDVFTKDDFLASHIYYSYFIYDLSTALKLLSKRTKYSDCVKLLGEQYSAEVPIDYFNLDDIKRTARLVTLLNNGLSKIIDYYLELYVIYESVDKSSLQDSQKIILLTKLNKILDEEYRIILCSVFNEPITEKGWYQDLFNKCNEIKNTIFFEFHPFNNLIKYPRVFVNIRTEYDYRKIKSKYKFIH